MIVRWFYFSGLGYYPWYHHLPSLCVIWIFPFLSFWYLSTSHIYIYVCFVLLCVADHLFVCFSLFSFLCFLWNKLDTCYLHLFLFWHLRTWQCICLSFWHNQMRWFSLSFSVDSSFTFLVSFTVYILRYVLLSFFSLLSYPYSLSHLS
jgi:hypothetical protein